MRIIITLTAKIYNIPLIKLIELETYKSKITYRTLDKPTFSFDEESLDQIRTIYVFPLMKEDILSQLKNHTLPPLNIIVALKKEVV